MQLREILDLDAMLTKDPAPESLSDDEDGDDNGEISEKTAGPSYKEEEDVEEESSDDEEDSMTERRAKRPVDAEEEDNTLSLAQMEETLKPQPLDRKSAVEGRSVSSRSNLGGHRILKKKNIRDT